MAGARRDADFTEIKSVLDEQRNELMAAHSLESDLDLAFHLQLQEALTASLAPHTSSPPPPSAPILQPCSEKETIFTITAHELTKFQQEALDRKRSLEETQRIKKDLQLRIHDQKFAREIARIPEDEWQEWGDNFERPFGEGCSKQAESDEEEDDCEFRIYFKGVVSQERVKEQRMALAGIGVAICDFRDNLILEIKKPLLGNGLSKQAAELKSLIEGLNAALSLELKRIRFFCDFFTIYRYVTGCWSPKQHKIAVLVDQVFLLQRKFTYCKPALIARNDVKYAFRLAREAIEFQITRPANHNDCKTLMEACVICLEDTDAGNMFSVEGCKHRYCFSCMKQHVEMKLRHGMMPNCPHEGCKSELTVESCKKFLTPKLIEVLRQRKMEASVPVGERIYCPYPQCSALMSRRTICPFGDDDYEQCKARICVECHRQFCFICKVPWHSNMTCREYKRMNPDPPAGDMKLKSLATTNLWRQCLKCNHMIELSEGCYHMTCRCGYEFCYNCGAEWRNKKATCSCPLWNENNILFESDEEFDEEEEEDLEDEEFYDSDYYYFS